MTTTLADRLLAADDEFTLRCNASTVADLNAARLAALAYAAAWHEVNGAGLRADEADALVRARADLAAMTTERDEAVAHGRAVYDLARSDERKAWQDATGCDTPADVRAVEREVMSGSPGSLADAARHLRRFLTAESESHRVAVAAAEVTAERDALDARVAALEAVVKAAASTLHVYVGEDFEVCRVCGIEDAKADHVDLDAYARGRDAADPVTVPAPDRAEELIIAQYDGCRKVAAELGHDGNWYAWGEWVKVHPRARHIQVESMRRALASLAAPSPRYVAVRRDEVNGRPASWFHTEAEAERYVALCNDNPDLFGADDEIEGALESYTHAVVDTGATPPAALPQVEAFGLPAVEPSDWKDDHEGGHVFGAWFDNDRTGLPAAMTDIRGRYILKLRGTAPDEPTARARVEAAVAVLAGRAEVRR